MDREILKKYDALKDEQKDVEKRINQLEREMNMLLETVVADTVKGTREDGTYGPIKIKGVPFAEYDQKKAFLQQRLRRYKAIETELAEMVGDIEAFIASVNDSRVRTILRYKYLDGMSWRMIARQYHKHSPSWPYHVLEKYFEEAVDKEKIEQYDENGK